MGIIDWIKDKFRKMPLSDEEYAGKVKDIKQKRNLTAQVAATTARKKERGVRNTLSDLSRQVEKASEVLGRLEEGAAQGNPDLIKESWRKGKAEIAKIEKIKVKVSAYAALISKILDETLDLKVSRGLRPQLKIYSADLLSETDKLETDIAEITNNVRQITDETDKGSKLWRDLTLAIKRASNSFSKILRDGEAGLALEQRIREELGRS